MALSIWYWSVPVSYVCVSVMVSQHVKMEFSNYLFYYLQLCFFYHNMSKHLPLKKRHVVLLDGVLRTVTFDAIDHSASNRQSSKTIVFFYII